MPQRILDNTAKNAVGAKTVDDGVALENVLPGYPFPDSEDRLRGDLESPAALQRPGLRRPALRATGTSTRPACATLAVTADAFWAWPIYDPKKSGVLSAAEPYFYSKLLYVGPARRNGEAVLIVDAVNPLKQPRRAWQYLPGQRRVKLAPDLCCDTPNPGAAGAGT